MDPEPDVISLLAPAEQQARLPTQGIMAAEPRTALDADDEPSHATQGQLGSLIEVQTLLALALSTEAGAVAALAEALSFAYAPDHVRVFVDEGAPMAALLWVQPFKRSGVDAVPVSCLGQSARAFEADAPGTAPGGRGNKQIVSGLVMQLSERELEVLELLAAGRQNQEIAAELFLALNTIKKHVTHIFEKLGVANRTEAAARARELGLLV